MSLLPNQIVFGDPGGGGGQAQDQALQWNSVSKALVLGIASVAASILFSATVTSAQITQSAPTSDVAAHDMLLQPQAPFFGASINTSPGNLNINIPAPIGGGSHSGVNIQDSGNTWLTFIQTPSVSNILFGLHASANLGQITTSVGNGRQFQFKAQSTTAASATGGPLVMTGGDGSGAGGVGGQMVLTGGFGATVGGDARVTGGAGTIGGGNVFLSSGSGPNSGSVLIANAGSPWLILRNTGAASSATLLSTTPVFTFTQQVTAGSAGAQFTIAAQGSTLASAAGGKLLLEAGNGGGTNGIGGDAVLQSGAGAASGSGAGGNVILNASTGVTHGSILVQDAGATWLTLSTNTGVATIAFAASAVTPVISQTGVTVGSGADFTVTAQRTTAASATGGRLVLSGGNNTVGASGVGGNVLVAGGAGNAGSGAGGSVLLNAGGGLTHGSVQFQDAGTTWLTLSETGSGSNLTFAASAKAPRFQQSTTGVGDGATIFITAQTTTASANAGGGINVVAGTGGSLGTGGTVSIAGGVGANGGSVALSPGNGGTKSGDIELFDGNANLCFRVDGDNTINKLSAPLLGDETTNDPLRFGVTSPIGLGGRSTDLALNPAQYANQTITFSGTPAASSTFSIVLPNVPGFTKVLDLTSVAPGVATLISAKAGTSTAPLSPGRATVVWYDGTTLHSLTSAGLIQSQSSSATGAVLTKPGYTSLTAGGSGITMTLAAGEKLIIDVSALLVTGSPGAGTLSAQYRVVVDAAEVSNDDISTDNLLTAYVQPYSRTVEVTGLSAGVHTVDFQARIDAGSAATFTSNNNTLRVMRSAA